MSKRKAGSSTVIEVVDNWLEASNRPSTTTETVGERNGSVVDGVEIVNPSPQSELATTAGKTSQPRLVGEPPRLLPTPTPVASLGNVAVPPQINDAASGDRPLPADLDPEREATLRALWSLLEDCGYETW